MWGKYILHVCCGNGTYLTPPPKKKWNQFKMYKEYVRKETGGQFSMFFHRLSIPCLDSKEEKVWILTKL